MQGSTKTWEKEEKAPPTRAWPAPVPHQIQRGHQELPTPCPTMSLEGRRSLTTTRNWKGTGKFTIEKWSCEMCAHICLSCKIIVCAQFMCRARISWCPCSGMFWSAVLQGGKLEWCTKCLTFVITIQVLKWSIIFTDICRCRWLSCPVFIRKGNLSICI